MHVFYRTEKLIDILDEPKIKCSELQSKTKKELIKLLEELRNECLSVRVAKVAGGAASKSCKLKVLHKAIARVNIVMHQKQKEAVWVIFKEQRRKPLDLRSKKTRAIRRKLNSTESKLITRKQANYPPRVYAVKV